MTHVVAAALALVGSSSFRRSSQTRCRRAADVACEHGVDRRTFLGALASAGVAAAGVDRIFAAPPGRIDMHHHFAPPAWVAEVQRPAAAAAGEHAAGRRSSRSTTWTAAASRRRSSRSPIPGSGSATRRRPRRLARACNEYGAKLVQDHPTRFGLFAAMPLPDVDATLQGNRLRLRHAEGRRRRPVHQLWRHVARQSRRSGR